MPNQDFANWLMRPFCGLPSISHEMPVNRSGVKNGTGISSSIVRRNGTLVRATAQANRSASVRLRTSLADA